MNQELSKKTGYTVSLILLVLVWSFAYAVPRYNTNRGLEANNDKFATERKQIAASLQLFAALPPDRPAPTPNTASWVTSNVLSGLQDKVESNSPYNNGSGVQIKLRAIQAQQISDILLKLREVNLVLKALKIEDRDGDGRWNLELMVEVPK